MNIYIYDFEVFSRDVLLGYCDVDLETQTYTIHQTWNLDEMREIYENRKSDTIWIGWNNNHYDDLIFEAIVNRKNPYLCSKSIVEKKTHGFCKIPLISYDLLNGFLTPFSLKVTEALEGDSIETTEVDFDLQRELTFEEKELTEKYNRSDLIRTYKNFLKFKGNFELRLSMIKEFAIPLQAGLRMTGTQIAAAALDSHANPKLKFMPVKPYLYDTLRLKNQELVSWFLNEEYKSGDTPPFDKGKSLEFDICNTRVTIAAGGMHSQTKKYHCDRAIYADISGYYNLIMMNFNLLPRTLDEAGKERYKFMYHEQLRLKKIDPQKRNVYKRVCLSVFGAMNNEYSDFYDPWQFPLVTTTGELFVYDLLEKLDGLGTAFNVNTDGIMFEPFDWNDEKKILDIIQEWVERNNFSVKSGIITDYHGRDVNCYIMRDLDGELVCKGEAVKNYDTSDKAFSEGSYFNCKEPPIIAKGLVAALLEGTLPENFVRQNVRDFKLYQYVSKKGSFEKLYYETIYSDGSLSRQDVQSPSRCFASNDSSTIGCLKKYKIGKHGASQIAKVQNIPQNIFVYNDEITSEKAVEKLIRKLDYTYYIKRIYERIGEFL